MKKSTRKTVRFLGGLVLIVGLLILFATFMSRRELTYKTKGVRTQAMVLTLSDYEINIKSRGSRSSVPVYNAKVRFAEATGKEIEASIASLSAEDLKEVQIGQTVEIIYLRDSPGTVLLKSYADKLQGAPLFLYPFGGVVLLVGFWMLFYRFKTGENR